MAKLSKQRKMRRDADRQMTKRFIERIDHLTLTAFGDIIGYSKNCFGADLLTNFQYTSGKVRVYILAAKKYTRINPFTRFGISDHAITIDEEGWINLLPNHGGFFRCRGHGSLNDFWQIVDKISKERTRYTRREMKQNPRLKNDAFSCTFARKPR